MKKMKLLGLAALSLLNINACGGQMKAEVYYVDFFTNIQREDFTLSNGITGKGNSLIYETKAARKDSTVDKPVDPTRPNYEFQGWYLEETCQTEWNFETDIVSKNIRLFAKWGVGQQDTGSEPEYTPPSTVMPEEAGQDYIVESVMNFKISNNQIKVGKAALDKLAANADNVLPLMEYKVKASRTFSATYADNKITVTCNGIPQVINVKDDSSNLVVDNTSYETKAVNYEKKALEEESYHVMLAGSSSIEFWTSSKEDLEPVVSYNHGIGGTTIEQWTDKLNQRLVYPYKPKMVVYYVGINNVINSKQTPDVIWTNLEKFFNDTHAAMPNTKVQYIMMNLIPGYKSYFDTINTVNAQVVEYQKSNPWLTLINPGTALIKDNGEPNAAYFRTDGLHLSNYGYVVWGGIIKESIIKGLENK